MTSESSDSSSYPTRQGSTRTMLRAQLPTPTGSPGPRRRFTPPCSVCRYPLLKSDKVCPRCVWEGRV